MSKQMKLKAVITSTAIALGLGAAGAAHALPYAIAYNNITNATVTDVGTVFILPSTNTSAASASLGGFPTVTTGGVNFTDAPIAEINSGAVENILTPVGPGGNYARGDAQIVSQETAGAAFTQVWNIAEANLDLNNTASATGRNASDTSFNISVGAGGGTIQFDFMADPYLQIIMPAGLLFPSVARAEITTNIAITDDLGNVVFSWAPDGINNGAAGVGGTVGGMETLDGASLNRTISRNFANPGTTTYDPTDCGVVDIPGGPVCALVGGGDVGKLIPETLASFSAITGLLSPGTYTLNLQGRETVDLARLSVPEPVSLGLVGIGLLGMGFASRRRKI